MTPPASGPSKATVLSVLAQQGWLLQQARRLVGRVMNPGHGPEDVVQDVITQALARPGSWAKSAELRGWLRRALRTRAAELGRKEALRATVALIDARGPSNHSPSALAHMGECALRLRELVDGLDSRSRRVVLLRVVEDLSFSDIAGKLDIRVDHARAIFSRAALRMRLRIASGAA